MTTASTFSVVRVNRTIFERSQRIFNKSRLVQRVRMDRDLDIETVSDIQAIIDSRRCCPPIFM